MFQYIIQPGESLTQIANQFGITAAAILAANAGLTPQLLFPGQIILIPVQVPVRQNFPWPIFLPNIFHRPPWRHGDHRGQRNRGRRDGRR